MAIPGLPNRMQEVREPRTLIGAKKVELAVVTYQDEYNATQFQLAVIGENNVHLLESRGLGLSKNTNPQGNASKWLRDQIFKALGKPVVEDGEKK